VAPSVRTMLLKPRSGGGAGRQCGDGDAWVFIQQMLRQSYVVMDDTPGMATNRNSEPAGKPYRCGRCWGRGWETCWWNCDCAFRSIQSIAINLLATDPSDRLCWNCAGRPKFNCIRYAIATLSRTPARTMLRTRAPKVMKRDDPATKPDNAESEYLG